MVEQNRIPFKLSGGTVVKYNASRPKIHPNADKPWLRYDPLGSGSLTLSMGTFAMFKFLSTQKGQDPEPTHVELVIRRMEQGVFFELALSGKNNPQAREFRMAGEGYRVLRDVNVQVEALDLQVDPGTVYTMEVAEAEDDEYSDVLAANWSTATAAPRPEKSDTASVKSQGEKSQETVKQQSKAPEATQQAERVSRGPSRPRRQRRRTGRRRESSLRVSSPRHSRAPRVTSSARCRKGCPWCSVFFRWKFPPPFRPSGEILAESLKIGGRSGQ